MKTYYRWGIGIGIGWIEKYSIGIDKNNTDPPSLKPTTFFLFEGNITKHYSRLSSFLLQGIKTVIFRNNLTFLVQLKECIVTANVPGLGLGGLGSEEIHRTHVVDSLNEMS